MALTEYDFSQTRNEIIRRALRICGALTAGESPTSEMQNDAAVALNAMIKDWQNDHIFLWTLRTSTASYLTGVNVASLAAEEPPILFIEKAWIVPNSGDNEPLEVTTWRKYQDIPDKAASGKPIVVASDERLSQSLYIYPTPTSNTIIGYLAVVKLKDFDSASATPDLTQRWINAITYGLASALGDEYGTPVSERREIERKYLDFYRKAKSGDRARGEYDFVQSAFSRR